jgi:hypothetical protein
MESDENLLSFSDLIRPLSTTPSPEPSLHFGTPPRTVGLGTLAPATLSEDDAPQAFVPSNFAEEEDNNDIIDDSRVAEMREAVIAYGHESNRNGSEQISSSWERRLAMMVSQLIRNGWSYSHLGIAAR